MTSSDRLPLYSAYVAALPDGLDSHPECKAKGSMLRVDLKAMPAPETSGLLPREIEALLHDLPLNSQWIPEVHNVAAHLAAYDLRFGDDWDAAASHIYLSNKRLLESPLYKALFLLASPGLLLRGAQWRWGQLHKGVELKAVLHDDRRSGTITLSYPSNLFSHEFVRGIGAGIKALLEANRTTSIEHEVTSYSSTHAVIEGSWGGRGWEETDEEAAVLEEI